VRARVAGLLDGGRGACALTALPGAVCQGMRWQAERAGTAEVGRPVRCVCGNEGVWFMARCEGSRLVLPRRRSWSTGESGVATVLCVAQVFRLDGGWASTCEQGGAQISARLGGSARRRSGGSSVVLAPVCVFARPALRLGSMEVGRGVRCLYAGFLSSFTRWYSAGAWRALTRRRSRSTHGVVRPAK
jgi:hypothetical protein